MRRINNLLLHLVLLITNWLPDNIIFLRIRGFLARPFFGSCGKNLRLGRNITFYNPKNIFLGNDIYIAFGNWFSAGETITIEDEVIFGPYSIIASSNHTRLNNSYRYGPPEKKKILIKHGCWIGGNCSILAGSQIGEGSIISAGSVTYEKVPENSKFINRFIFKIKE